jgi:DNA-binding NtrC family response regulator
MSKRILVVEDHADNRQIIRDMLAPTDYEITEAENGQEALAAIAKQRPDLILMGTDAQGAAILPTSTTGVAPRRCAPQWRRPSSDQPARLAACP